MFLKHVGSLFRITEARFSSSAHKINECRPSDDLLTRLLKVAIIGIPNSGKSTFINYLMDRKVCPTSSKVHTTRTKATAVFTEGDSQIVFLDTPGLVNPRERKKYNLGKSFLKDSRSSLHNADIIGVIHDASNIWTRDKLDIKVIRLLETHKNSPSFLVLNKVDIIRSKRKLLDITRLLTENCIDGKPIPGNPIHHRGDSSIRGWPYFQEIFMVSALTGNGLDAVKDFLIRKAKPSQWLFPPDIWSDQTPQQIIVNSVKAKLLDFLPQEIPYELKPELEFFEVNDKGAITAVVVVQCPNQRKARLVAGESDGKLRQITESLQRDLQETFHNYVRIRVVLQSYKNSES